MSPDETIHLFVEYNSEVLEPNSIVPGNTPVNGTVEIVDMAFDVGKNDAILEHQTLEEQLPHFLTSLI